MKNYFILHEQVFWPINDLFHFTAVTRGKSEIVILISFQEYEVVEEEESNGEWEKELEDMLGEAPEGQTETKEESKKD